MIKPKLNTPKWILVHHTAGLPNDPLFDSSVLTIKQIDEAHKARWPWFPSGLGYFVGYHYVITADGKITQTRPDEEEGAHCIGMNTSSIGIALTGNFNGFMPTFAQENSLRELLARLTIKYGLSYSKIVPHRAFWATDCYGKNLKDDWARNLMARGEDQIKISLLQQLIQLYIKLINQIKQSRMGKGFGNTDRQA